MKEYKVFFYRGQGFSNLVASFVDGTDAHSFAKEQSTAPSKSTFVVVYTAEDFFNVDGTYVNGEFKRGVFGELQVAESTAEIARLTEALKHYADPANWHEGSKCGGHGERSYYVEYQPDGHSSYAPSDPKKVAREALEGL